MSAIFEKLYFGFNTKTSLWGFEIQTQFGIVLWLLSNFKNGACVDEFLGLFWHAILSEVDFNINFFLKENTI